MTLVDQADRDRIRHDLDTTLVVEAAAGTGKTTELVARMVETIAEGRAAIDGLVAVTFTEKAAGELKLRLREEIERARDKREGDARARLEVALAHLEDAHVNTIHGFCADLLRERPVEAGVDPRFEVLLEPSANGLLDAALDDWLHDHLEAPGEGLRRVLRRTFWSDDTEAGPRGALRRAVRDLAEWRDFTAPWRRDPIDRRRTIVAALEAVLDFATLSARGTRGDPLYESTAPIRRFAVEHPMPEAAAITDEWLDGIEARLGPLLRGEGFTKFRVGGRGAAYGKEVTRQQARDAHAALKATLEEVTAALDADLAACLHQELQPCLEGYEQAKRARGALDFTDLLIRARDLLRGHASVREALQRRYDRLFIDEFQDTDPIQAEILLLLAADDPAASDWTSVRPVPGKLFIVGDPKQAIYRFRRADVETYWRVKEQLRAAGAEVCQLRTCFRSVPTIQRAINHVFAPVMDGHRESAQASYVPLEPVRSDPGTQPSLVVLPVPSPYGSRNVSASAIEESLPDAVGAYVDWLVNESGWTVSERSSSAADARVPIQPRHIAILFRRFVSFGRDVTREYVAALEARQITHLLVGGRSFHEREEVDALRVALTAIEWPDDELALYATLRGSLFAFTDDMLLAYRQAHGPLRVWDHARRDDTGASGGEADEVTAALRLLGTLHRERNRVPVQDTVQALLRETRAHASLALRPGGEQALANVLHVVELARQYEATEGSSFRGFVQELLDETRTEAAESPILEEGSEGVRLMTVHRAKGLEFPVVILADITCRLSSDRPARALDASRNLCVQMLAGCAPAELLEARAAENARDRAEGHRLAYVAATRARDLLIVPGVGDGPYPGPKHGERWIDVMNRAIYPERPWPAPLEAPGTPPFGRDTVLHRPEEELAYATPIRPGRYTLGPADASFDVTWWDPATLHLEARPTFGKRQLALIDRNASESRVEEGLATFRAWEQRHATRVERGATPSLRVVRVTDAARSLAVPVDAIAIEQVAHRTARRGGVLFGALVHEVLADVPLDADAPAIAALASFKARALGADDQDVTVVTRVIEETLAHPLVRRAAAALQAGRCHREAPITLRHDDGTWIEGQLDLAFEDADGWTVVDFKTDADLDRALDDYRRQVALYVDAVQRATGRPARGVLLRI